MRLRTIARVLFSLSAAGAIALLIRHVGTETFLALLRTALPWLPLLLGLEASRIAADVIALRKLCGDGAERLSFAQWIRLHLVSNAALFLPGGRAVSEGTKLARLGPLLGAGPVIARLSVLYAAHLLATALIASAAAIAALLIGDASPFAALIASYALFCFGFAVVIRVAVYRARVPRSIARWFGDGGAVVTETNARDLPIVPIAALVAKLANRGAQVAQFAVLLFAFGAPSDPARALLANGVSLVGGAVAELSPAQLGGTDGALALSAPFLSVGLGVAVALATLMRAVQLAWTSVGAALSLYPTR